MEPRRRPPYRIAGLVLLLACAAALSLVYAQFVGTFTTTTPLTLLADRAGLVMDTGAKVTYNGVEIGRVAAVTEQDVGGTRKARLLLDIDPAYVAQMPVNVVARSRRRRSSVPSTSRSHLQKTLPRNGFRVRIRSTCRR